MISRIRTTSAASLSRAFRNSSVECDDVNLAIRLASARLIPVSRSCRDGPMGPGSPDRSALKAAAGRGVM